MAQKIDLDSERLLLWGQTTMLQCVTLSELGFICLTYSTCEESNTVMTEADNGIVPVVLHMGRNYGHL